MNEYSSPIDFIDLKKQQSLIRDKINTAIKKVLDHGQYIMGPEVKEFESKLCDFAEVKHSLTCANGTDAITLVLMAWDVGPGDAVFVPSFTYIATAEAPFQAGATPFFVDVCPKTFNIEPNSFKQAIIDCKKLNLIPKVVIPVDLFGQPSNVKNIQSIAHEDGIKVLVDGAQSFGAMRGESKVGSMGDATTTSFFPAKPLGCYGDGGAVFTNNDVDAELINSIRLHGKGSQKYDNVRVGVNSRLDTIQAAILLEKLKIFPKELELRNKIASIYNEKLSSKVKKPHIDKNVISSWAQYTIISGDRNKLQNHLSKHNIPSIIYYPIPLSKQIGYNHFPHVSTGLQISEFLSDNVLSLPMHPYMPNELIQRICNVVNSFSNS